MSNGTSAGNQQPYSQNGRPTNGVTAKTTTQKTPQAIGKGQQKQITNFFPKTNSILEQLNSETVKMSSSSNSSMGHHQPRSVTQDGPSNDNMDGAAAVMVSSNSIDKQPNGGQGSPLRSQLGLNLKTHSPATTKPSPLLCPMCPYLSDSSNVLEEHINRAHFDPLSPSINNGSYSASSSSSALPSTTHSNPHRSTNASATNANGSRNSRQSNHDTLTALACPICCRAFESPSDLELHVNIEHRDILSPANAGDMSNGATNASAATATSGLTSSYCPVCNISLDRMQTQEMELHIEGHFAKSPQLSATKAETELEKQAQKLREQREFEMLRAQYGMDDQGNFREQSAAGMQRAVYAGEMSVADYYERQVGLRAAESHGIDDGTSCTRSVAPRVASLSAASPNVMRSLVCSAVDHYASSYGDKGWGCGYRNLQMLLSSLLQVRYGLFVLLSCFIK